MITDQQNEKLANQQNELLHQLTLQREKTLNELDEKERKIQHQEAQRIVKNHVLSGSAIGLIPIPFVDTFALSSNQVNMLHRLSEHYDLDFNKRRAKVILTALVSGSLPLVAVLGLSSALKVIPGIGTLGGNASLSVLGGAITYATGQSLVKHFEAGGTIHDFHAKSYIQFFKRKIKKGMQFVQNTEKKETNQSIPSNG
jgi:uncharacterized protein (DUF697 family)